MDFLVICVSNSYQGDISFSHGMPVTQKEDKRYHGYGTKSIRNIVSQYGGTVVFRAEKGWFEVKATYDFNSLSWGKSFLNAFVNCEMSYESNLLLIISKYF